VPIEHYNIIDVGWKSTQKILLLISRLIAMYNGKNFYYAALFPETYIRSERCIDVKTPAASVHCLSTDGSGDLGEGGEGMHPLGYGHRAIYCP